MSEVDIRLLLPCDTFRMRRRARNEDDKRERRAALVAAALATFDETSYEAVTMTSVAVRAGLAKGTLYLYFGTKEDLFLSVVEDRLGTGSGRSTRGSRTVPHRSGPMS
jgi:AcrR family transcriptional regulator